MLWDGDLKLDAIERRILGWSGNSCTAKNGWLEMMRLWRVVGALWEGPWKLSMRELLPRKTTIRVEDL